MPITPAQSRAARALLGFSQQELADRAKVGKQTLADFERGARTPYHRTLRDIEATLEDAGIEFIPENGGGVGVRFRERRVAD
ncbi:helix-turn-helix transcriptional regulator [Magnetospirillum sp. UT-4]|uniref:helix-turn-helix transcriptional regulator n=1 Tax=Magnetospirillum sp. UT-4 TaxID=2681467 RepID=UPI0015726D14|nr:helix-turn-helix transcriptional regulator [Magnetospirillum sp. UT-4]